MAGVSAETNPGDKEFVEVAHSGGTIIIRFQTRPDGIRAYSQEWRHQRPTASSIFAIYVLPPGVPVGDLPLGGIGSPIPPPSVPGAVMTFVASDSQGLFGRRCPQCSGYWRSQATSPFCAYCGFKGPAVAFTTDAQSAYLQQYCALFSEGLGSGQDGEYAIDLDAVADAVSSIEKPPFYYVEESQQNRFRCRECNTENDILGRFGYCTLCGTRNDLQELETKAIPEIRRRINTDGTYESCVKDSVSAFDSFVSQYVKEAIRRVPLSVARRNRMDGRRFHNLTAAESDLREVFDWRLLQGVSDEDVAFASLMFHRRHLYEHNGGEVDQRYLDESGDTTVRLKQALRETQESAHRIAGVVVRMAQNVHLGFHELSPVDDRYIRLHKRP